MLPDGFCQETVSGQFGCSFGEPGGGWLRAMRSCLGIRGKGVPVGAEANPEEDLLL